MQETQRLTIGVTQDVDLVVRPPARGLAAALDERSGSSNGSGTDHPSFWIDQALLV